MLHSMTGFAREAAESPLGTLTCELRAVNHRYLDIQFRLPDELRPKELQLRAEISAALKRGKVECSVHLRRAASESAELRLNQPLVRQLVARSAELSELVPDMTAMNSIDLLRWPGVVEEPVIDTEPLFEHARKLLGRVDLAQIGQVRAGRKRRRTARVRCRLAYRSQGRPRLAGRPR